MSSKIYSKMEVPHLSISLSENSLVNNVRDILKIFRPNWNLSTVQFKAFTDGITNKLIGCFNADKENDVVLIRMYGNKTDLLIDRKSETKNIKLLHSAGLAPKLYGTFDNGIVYEYVPGEVLTRETCRLDNVFVLVARKLADMHSVKAVVDDSVRESVLWKTIKKFMSLVPDEFSDKEKQTRFDELYPNKPDLEKEYSFLEKELKKTNSPIVFCHNDLLLGNVIFNPDRNSVTFIDYEYAGYNYQAYDIANHFNEYAGVENPDYSLFPDEKYQKKWLEVYLERYGNLNEPLRETYGMGISQKVVESLYLEVEKFTLASHFLWGIWSLVQVEYSSIDFDFVNYSYIRFGEYYKRKEKLFYC